MSTRNNIFIAVFIPLLLTACSTVDKSTPDFTTGMKSPTPEAQVSHNIEEIKKRAGQCIMGSCEKGLGIKEYADETGGQYAGDWKDSCWHGDGTYVELKSGGFKYEGQFYKCSFHGQGKETWASGSRYVGQFRYHKRDGKGVFTWADGKEYAGGFKDNRRSGFGVLTYPANSHIEKYEGPFKAGVMEGEGTVTLRDGTIAKGEFRDDEPHEEFTITRPDGREEIQVWDLGNKVSSQN